MKPLTPEIAKKHNDLLEVVRKIVDYDPELEIPGKIRAELNKVYLNYLKICQEG